MIDNKIENYKVSQFCCGANHSVFLMNTRRMYVLGKQRWSTPEYDLTQSDSMMNIQNTKLCANGSKRASFCRKVDSYSCFTCSGTKENIIIYEKYYLDSIKLEEHAGREIIFHKQESSDSESEVNLQVLAISSCLYSTGVTLALI